MAYEFDVAVVGLGAAGSAILRALARRGAKVVGLDRYAPPHDLGSSHGETRIFRTAYGEGAAYSPILKIARSMWLDLERELDVRLFEPQGLVYCGPRSSGFLNETLRSGETHGVELRMVDGDERSKLGFSIPSAWMAFVEPEAGYLYPERAIEAFLKDAAAHGAEIRTSAPCLGGATGGEGVELRTSDGVVSAKRVVVSAGAWSAALLPQLAPHLRVERRTIHWFGDPTGRWTPDKGFRTFYIEDEQGLSVYGFPNLGSGIKIGEHIEGQAAASPDEIVRRVRRKDETRTRALASRYFAGLGEIRRSDVCLYPMSSDSHFIVGPVPGEGRIIAACGLCGHGFKFAPVLGESVAALALGETPKIDLSMFAPDRFAYA
jgi:sarcosine oxidase